MKAKLKSQRWGCVIAGLLWMLGSLVAHGQPYSIAWYTLDGGGGTSSGGTYSVTGTIGQPDAGRSSGGIYVLNGGFWGMLAAAQPTNVPCLTITHLPTNSVVVSWPLPADGWVLEWTNRVARVSAPWVQLAPPYEGNSTQAWIMVPWPPGSRFYRLRKP